VVYSKVIYRKVVTSLNMFSVYSSEPHLSNSLLIAQLLKIQ